MNWFPSKSKPPSGPDEGISLGREDNERVERWQRAVKRVRVTRNLLKLAWTAGPVTGIGLYGGYYIGYGRPPATDLLIYFITFTILSGLLGLLAAIVYDTTYGAAKERAQQDVLETVDLLGDLILAVRDLAMEGFEPEIRRREAATQLLQRVDLSPEAVAFACEELIGERELGRCLAKIDTFRRAGLYSRIRDLHQDQGEAFDKALSELHRVAPIAASVLRERYMGDAPKLQDGMPRDEFFLERVMAAIDEDNLLLMTPGDVEAMLLLAFELINGREIPMLTFSYAGRWRLASVLDHLEAQRSRYRVARAASSNRMRALASWLVEVEVLAYEEVPEGISASLLVDRVVAALDRLTRQLAVECNRLRRRQQTSTAEIRRLGDILATSLRLYRMAHDAYRELGRVHADLLRASEEWERLQDLPGENRGHLHLGPGRKGLRIVEKVIALDEDACEAVCQHLVNYLHGEQLERRGRRFFTRQDGRRRALTLEGARQLAVEMALALDPHIHLSRPEVQRGIGASRASYLGNLEPGMSAQEKRALGEAMAQEVVQDMSQPAERLALALVRHYRVNLTQEAKHFLRDHYGAREQVLNMIAQSHVEEMPQMNLLSQRPTAVPTPRRDWYRSLVRARRLLD